MQNKPDDFVERYQQATSDPDLSAKVPLLELDGGDVLVESMVILDYLEEVAPSVSYSASQRARMRMFANLFPGRLSSIGILKADANSEEEAAAVSKLRKDLKAMNDFLVATSESGPFLCGDEFTYAESAAAPFAQRLAIVLPGLRPHLDPMRWLEDDGCDRLAKWMDAVCKRPSCVNSLPPPEEICESYGKLVERMKAMSAAKA